MKILFYDTKKYDKKFFLKENENHDFKITFLENKLNLETAELAEGYSVVCCFVNDSIDKDVIDMLVKMGVKLIALRCSGYNNINIKYAKDKIKIVRVPAYSPSAIAEYTIALLLTLNRKINKAYIRTREGNFSLEGLLGFNLEHKTIGIIGTGRIAKILIRILKGFNMNIIAYDKYPDNKISQDLGFEYVSLDTLYRTSDIISLNCPLTPETKYMINRSSMNLMKDGVTIINTGRGALIDSVDLVEALKDHKVGAAALDVYEEESEYFFEDFSNDIVEDDILARLLSFNNVLITSHQAFFTEEAVKEIAKVTLNNIAFFNKDEIKNEVFYTCDDNNCYIKD